MIKAIPKQDMDVINTALKGGLGGDVQTIRKGTRGEMLSAIQRGPISSGFVIKDFSGKVFKHQVSVVKDGAHIIVAEAGQKYDDISLDLRRMVVFSESDFQ